MRVRLHLNPLLDNDNLIGEWQVFQRALKQETKLFMETNKLTKMSTLSAVKVHMEAQDPQLRFSCADQGFGQ